MSYTYEKVGDYDLLEEGDYEVKIERIAEQVTNSGAEKIGIKFRVRSDVDQKYQNRCLFEDIWKSRNEGRYNPRRLNQLLGTQELEDGHTFESIEEMFEFLTGANLLAHVVVSFDDWSGKDINRIAYYKPSKNKPQVLNSNINSNNDNDKKVIDDDDLPF